MWVVLVVWVINEWCGCGVSHALLMTSPTLVEWECPLFGVPCPMT